MGEGLYRSHLDSIQRIIALVCRRQGFYRDLGEEFTSHAHEKLIENDYAILAKFRGESRLETFLRVAVTRLAQDFRNHKWGKWRPSAAARRLGEPALTLERLLHRDGHSFDEAAEIMRTNLGLPVSEAELDRLAGQLPRRMGRRLEGDEPLCELPSGEDQEQSLLRREGEEALERLTFGLREALSVLDTEERLIIRMHFEQGMSWTRIARALHLPRRALYSRKDAALTRLRRHLESQGITRRQVQLLFEEVFD